jgi:hypothetical protein
MNAESEPSAAVPQRPPLLISGKLVVLGMFLMGLLATGTIFVYWDLHTKPFRPLTEAIGRTFKNSLPKVEGGRHKKDPTTLRIAMRVPFSPEIDESAAQETLKTVCELIRQHQDLAGYDRIQIYFFQMVPEETAKSKLFEFTPAEIANGNQSRN